MTISDTIQIISIVCTSFLSIIAIAISIFTLIQNNKMIEESSRPDISIFKHVIAINSPDEYFVLKNFGKTGAQITNITCNVDLDKYLFRNPFKYLIGTYIAPNQSFVCDFDSKKIAEKILDFTIEYKSELKKYTSYITINLEQNNGILYSKITTRDKELQTISNTLQEYLIQRI